MPDVGQGDLGLDFLCYFPRPSNRQHLSYDDCLEVKQSELFCAVLYMTVMQSDMHVNSS